MDTTKDHYNYEGNCALDCDPWPCDTAAASNAERIASNESNGDVK